MKRYEFFWSGDDYLSNFYLKDFTYKEQYHLTCSEQGYMFEKARFFNDLDMAGKILKLTNPAAIKHAGRLVKNYEDKLWSTVKENFMYDVLVYKFKDKELRKLLIDTGDSVLVEASPFDKEWGIGLSRYDAIRTQESLWPGKNLLGKVLMKVRDDINNGTEYL